MSRQRLSPLFFGLTMLLVVVAVLAACNGDDDKDGKPTSTPTPVPLPPTLTPTVPPVVTRIVPLDPTQTPLPTPYYEFLEPVAGQWAVIFELEITDLQIAQDAYVDLLRYSGVASVDVHTDSMITGRPVFANLDESEIDETSELDEALRDVEGYFTPYLFHNEVNPATGEDETCTTQVLEDSLLTFDIQGTTRQEADGSLWAGLSIMPDDPNHIEHYVVLCREFQDTRSYNKAILWPLLDQLGWLHWDFPLDGEAPPLTFTIDLAGLNNERYRSGILTATVSFHRN